MVRAASVIVTIAAWSLTLHEVKANAGLNGGVDFASQAQAQLDAARAAWVGSSSEKPLNSNVGEDEDDEPDADLANSQPLASMHQSPEELAAAAAAKAQREAEEEEEEARQEQLRAEIEAKAAIQRKQREEARARELAREREEAEAAARAQEEKEAQEKRKTSQDEVTGGAVAPEMAGNEKQKELGAEIKAKAEQAARAEAQEREDKEKASAAAAVKKEEAVAKANELAQKRKEEEEAAAAAAAAVATQAAKHEAEKLAAAAAARVPLPQVVEEVPTWQPGPHQVCASLSATSVPSPFLAWSDAIFTVPRRRLREGDVMLSSQPLALFQIPCSMESWAGTEVLHFFGFCGDSSLTGGGRTAPRLLGAGEVACPPSAADDECFIRASPFGTPCLELSAKGAGYRPPPSASDAGFKFIGYQLSRFDGVGGAPFEEPWLWEGFLGSLSQRSLWLSWLNFRRPVYLLAGLAITFAVEPLVENRAFQYAIASFAGVSFFLSLALLLIYLCFSHLLKVSQQTAWGSFLHNTALFLPPLAAVFYRTLFNTAGTFCQMMLAFWSQGTCFLDPLGGEHSCHCSLCAPWVGKAYFGAGALLGLILESRCRFFKYPEWVYEDQGWAMHKCGQKHLAYVMRCGGLGCFFLAFSSTDAGLVLAFLMTKSARDQLMHWVLLAQIARSTSGRNTIFGRNGHYHRLSQEEYEAQMKSTTERELMRLRSYVNQQHEVMVRAGGNSNRTSGSVLQRANFDEETTRRLEAFRVGGADAKRPWERTTAASLEVDDDDDDDDEGSGSSRGSGGGGRVFMKRLRRKASQLAITVAVVGTCAALLKYLWTEL